MSEEADVVTRTIEAVFAPRYKPPTNPFTLQSLYPSRRLRSGGSCLRAGAWPP